ncbi:MAG: hypothetical protein J2P48_17490, partial [Alphaproteobacteria bacterium]|nr:hypothetical protein [Alphaproteobacteria bacterium]
IECSSELQFPLAEMGRTDPKMGLAAGDHVRPFKRVKEGKTVVGNNGDVVEVLHGDTAGIRARVMTRSAVAKWLGQLIDHCTDTKMSDVSTLAVATHRLAG